MSATYRITQGAGVGEYGIARQDLTKFSVGGLVTLEAQDQTGGLSDYVWEVLSEPEGSAITVVTPTPAAPWIVTLTLTEIGGHLVRLIFKPGTVDEDISVLYLGVPLANSGLCIPASNETIFDNSYAASGSGDTYVGYERKVSALYRWVDTQVGGGTLDTVYNGGRIVVVDEGAVYFSNTVSDATNTLELVRSKITGTATGSALQITNNLGGGQTQVGASISLTGSGTQSIWSDKSLYVGSSAAFGGGLEGVHLQNVVTSGAALVRVMSSSSSSDAETEIRSNGVGTGIVRLAATGADATGWTRVFVTADGGTNGGLGHVGISALGGNAFITLGSAQCYVTLNDQYRHGSTWTGLDHIKLSSSSAEWSALEANCGATEVSLIQAINLAFAGSAGGNTLDGAYDQGGSGVGKAITADSGAVAITNAVNDATNTLELTRSETTTATGCALHVTNELEGYQAQAGSSIYLTAGSAGKKQSIWSDQELYIGSSVTALGVYLQNVAASALVRVQAVGTGVTGGGTVWVTANGAGNGTGYLLLSANGAGTGGMTTVDLKAVAGSTGPGVVNIYASGGAAAVNVGGANCDVRFNDNNRAGSTWTGQSYLQLSDSSAEWSALEANCGASEVSLIQAINLAFADSGDEVTLAASATTGGLSLTGQEIGNQVAAATPVAMSETSMGDPATASARHFQAIDAGGTWVLTDQVNEENLHIFAGGTSWTLKQAPNITAGAGYRQAIAYFDSEVWIVGDGAVHQVESYSISGDTWTSRGKPSAYSMGAICVHGSALIAGGAGDGTVYQYTSGTSWTSLGTPYTAGWGYAIKYLASNGTDLFAIASTIADAGYRVGKYVSGTTWTNISFPATMNFYSFAKIWKGSLIVGGRDGSGYPVVYKYVSGTTWTQLGTSALQAITHGWGSLAVDSSDNLYAFIRNTPDKVFLYNEAGDSWSSRSLTLSNQEIWDGEFNANDEICLPGENLATLWKDNSMSYDNGYLTGEDWETFNDKSDGIASTDITEQDTVTAVAADYVLISDTGDSGNLKKALVSDFGGGGGGMAWSKITASTTATSGNGYMVDASGASVTVSLPSSPSEGDTVGIQVFDASNGVLVNRNTKNIEGAAFSPPLSKGDSVTFVYAEATEGWVNVATSGGRIHAAVTGGTTATLDTFSDSTNGAVQYQYYIFGTGTKIRSGTVRAHWDGVGNTHKFDDSAVTSIGDTSDFTFDVDISSDMVRLRATATSTYSVRLVKTRI